MVQEFIPFALAGWVSAAWVAVIALGLGLALWLAGSRFSQTLVTLTAVAVGAWVGKRLPGWMGWGVDPIGTCFGGALLLGLLGYLYHRMWVGVGLGVQLAVAAGVGTWMYMGHGREWSWPALSGLDYSAYAQALWQGIPADVQKIMPWAVAGAGFIGMTVAAIFPRLAERMFYSILGVTLLALAANLRFTRVIPQGTSMQWEAAGALVLLGALVQWWIGPKRAVVAQEPVAAEAPADEE